MLAFFNTLATDESMMIKSLAGGGGRGMRVVSNLLEVEEAFNRCQSEAIKSFGNGALYAEKYLPKVRHYRSFKL